MKATGKRRQIERSLQTSRWLSGSHLTKEQEQRRAQTFNSQGAMPPRTSRMLHHQESAILALLDSVHKQAKIETNWRWEQLSQRMDEKASHDTTQATLGKE